MEFDFMKDPRENFDLLLKRAEESKLPEPNAMGLATASADGEPALRTVLFKGWVGELLSFYTNYESNKSLHLHENPRASLLFFWPPMSVQVRWVGRVQKLSRQQSEVYFASRPRLSQVGAWASQQSREIPSLQILEAQVAEVERRFMGKEIPCPAHWGGWGLQPSRVEFWFGKEGRLHERYCYERSDASNLWRRFLRSP